MSATTKTWVNGLAPTCEDVDLNGFKNENNNLIIGAGIGLSTADNQQTHKAVAHYAGVGDYYVDSGSANVYVLSTTGSQTFPPTYATGMRIRFVAGNTNTGASTVNVAGLGVKDVVNDATGSALSAGAVTADALTEAYYDGTSFRIVSVLATNSIAWTPTVEGGTVAGTGWAYDAQVGRYSLVGNLLFLNILLNVNTIGSGATGNVLMPLPLAVSGFNQYTVGAIRFIDGVTMTAGYKWMTISRLSTGDDLLIWETDGGGGNSIIDITQIAAPFKITASIVLEIA